MSTVVTAKEEIDVIHRRLGSVNGSSGALSESNVNSILDDLSKVFGILKDGHTASDASFRAFLRYLKDLLPLLKDKKFEARYEDRIATVFVGGLNNSKLTENTHACILMFVSELRENGEFLSIFATSGLKTLRDVLEKYKNFPNSFIVSVALYIIMCIASKNIEKIVPIVGDPFSNLLIDILFETTKDETFEYAMEIMIALMKNSLVTRTLLNDFAIVLKKNIDKPSKENRFTIITRGIIALLDLVTNKAEAKDLITNTELVGSIKKMCTREDAYVDYVVIFYYLHLAGVNIDVSGTQGIFMDAFVSGKCPAKTRDFSFANILREPSTLRTLVDRCGGYLFDYLKQNKNKEIFERFLNILDESEDDFLRSDRMDYKSLNEVLNIIVGLCSGSEKIISKLFSKKFLGNKKIVYSAKDLMKVLYDTDSAGATSPMRDNALRLLYCGALRTTLERNIDNAVCDFVLCNGIGMTFDKKINFDKYQKDYFIRRVVNFLMEAEPNVEGAVKYIMEKNAPHIFSGIKEGITAMFALVRAVVERGKCNFKIENSSILDIIIEEMRKGAVVGAGALADCCKAIDALISFVPINKELVERMEALYSSYRGKNSPISPDLEKILRKIRDLKSPSSLLLCKSNEEVLALLKNVIIKDNSDLNVMVSLLRKNSNTLLIPGFVDAFARNKNVFSTYDAVVKYDIILNVVMYVIDRNINAKEGIELLEFILREALRCADSNYFSKLCENFDSNKFIDKLRANEKLKRALLVVDNRELLKKLKQPPLSTDDKKALIGLLKEEKDLLYFLKPEDLLNVVLSLILGCPRDTTAIENNLDMCIAIIESSSLNLFNISVNCSELLDVIKNSIEDMKMQEKWIRVVRRINVMSSHAKPKFVGYVTTLMEMYRENISIQEEVSMILDRIYKEADKKEPKKKADNSIIINSIYMLESNHLNVIISENVLNFLCAKNIVSFVQGETNIRSFVVKVVVKFLRDDKVINNELKEKAVRILYAMIKVDADVSNHELWSDIVMCAKSLFFEVRDKAKAHFAKILAKNESKWKGFAEEVYKRTGRDGNIRKQEVWRLLSKYIRQAEEINVRERGKEIDEVCRFLQEFNPVDKNADFKQFKKYMKDERGSLKVATMVLIAIKAAGEGITKYYYDINYLKHVKKIMVLYYDSMDIQRHGCEIMSLYSAKSQFYVVIADGYCKELLFDNLKRFSQHKDTQQSITNIIKNVISINKNHEFANASTIEELSDLVESIKKEANRDQNCKRIIVDIVSIIESISKNPNLDIPDGTIECLKDVYDICEYNESKTILNVIYTISKNEDRHYELIQNGWVDKFGSVIEKRGLTPGETLAIVKTLNSLLKAVCDDCGDDERDDDGDLNMFSQDENGNNLNKKGFVKEVMKSFVDSVDLAKFMDIIAQQTDIDLQTLFTDANELLGHLLKYRSVRERIGDFAWLYYSVESMNKVMIGRKVQDQKKDLKKTCVILWKFAIETMQSKRLPVIGNFVAFLESGLTTTSAEARRSIVPALCSILAHENNEADVPKTLNQNIRKVREDFRDSRIVQACSDAILGNKDKRVECALRAGVCTRIAVPDCDSDCYGRQGLYCEKCCVVQKLYMCKTCGDKRLLCDHCRNAYHRGHETERMASVGVCQSENGVKDGNAKRELVLKSIEEMEAIEKIDFAKAAKSGAAARKKVSKKHQGKVGEEDEEKDGDETGEPAKKKRRLSQEGVKKTVIDNGCVLNRLLDDLMSNNVSGSNDGIRRDCSRVDLSAVTLKSALEKAGVKGVDEICAVCAESMENAKEDYSLNDDIPNEQAKAIYSLQLSLGAMQKASSENNRTPCEVLCSALLEKRRHLIEEVKDLLALVLSGLGYLDKRSFPALFRAIPLSSPLLLGQHSDAGHALDLPLVTFAATELSTVTKFIGTNTDRYAVVIFVGSVCGYDISKLSFKEKKEEHLDVIMEPGAKITVKDIARCGGNNLTVVTAYVSCPVKEEAK